VTFKMTGIVVVKYHLFRECGLIVSEWPTKAMQWAMSNGQSPNTPPVMVGRAVLLVAPKQCGCAPRLPTGRFKRFHADACQHGALPWLRIQVAAWQAKEFVPVKRHATLAARCGERALPTACWPFPRQSQSQSE
jgi:hypothetical protein